MKTLLILILLLSSNCLNAQQNSSSAAIGEVERAGFYRTREERREAGLGTKLTDWLTFSGLFEAENIREVTEFTVGLPDQYDYETDPSVQAAFDISVAEIFEIELILEYSEDPRDPLIDEFVVATDLENFGFSVGRFYAPFGLYYSHFVTGPMLEFAETRRDMLQVDYDFQDMVEFAIYTFDGETRALGDSSDDTGWGASVDAFLFDGRLNIGAGYISNLAESDEEFLREENNIFLNKVGAWSLYGVFEANTWDLSLEVIKATANFREFERNENHPESWNIEAAYFPTNNFEIAIRYERSQELVDFPQEQYGIALTWRFLDNLSMTAEYLWSDYKTGFVEEDDDIFVTRGNTIAAWIAFEF